MPANVIVATKTLALLEEAVARDQGAAFRQMQAKVLPHMADAYRGAEEGFRSHLGASVLGSECGRAIWYGFRWATKTRVTGRMLRLWNRGHLEEGRFLSLLLVAGIQVYQQDAEGKQFRISGMGGHFGGSGDGVGIGFPDLPANTAALLEFKTHNDKSFADLKKQGVRAAKLEHFVQMQTYMRKMGLSVAMYFAINKNSDEIYCEIVPLDTQAADTFIERAYKIIPMQEAPSRISKSPGWITCQWCDHKPVCHLKAAPERNCRTCVSSVPRDDGTWWCENKERQMQMSFGPRPGIFELDETLELSKARQLAGCAYYVVNTAMHS